MIIILPGSVLLLLTSDILLLLWCPSNWSPGLLTLQAARREECCFVLLDNPWLLWQLLDSRPPVLETFPPPHSALEKKKLKFFQYWKYFPIYNWTKILQVSSPDLLCNSWSLRAAASLLEDFCFGLFPGSFGKFGVGKGFSFPICFTAAASIFW